MAEQTEGQLVEQVMEAAQAGSPLAITGGNTKSFYGREIIGTPLDLSGHRGVVEYQPTELVMTVKAGTPIQEINRELDRHNQMLGFDPPRFSPGATIGGAVAAGLAGPGRPFYGSVGDFILGIKLLTGRAEVLRFGGQVIKNVAGFDLSRLMVGALGCLGVLLEVSIKVIPKPEDEITLVLEHADEDDAVLAMNRLATTPLPITSASWFDGLTRIRLSGSRSGIRAAKSEIGGQQDLNGPAFWTGLRDQTHGFFENDQWLHRASVASASRVFCKEWPQLVDWGGAVRWGCFPGDNREFSRAAKSADGHCCHFRNGDRTGEVFAPLDAAMMRFHQQLKAAFDPARVLNPGRLYAEI
ncbi:MAG: glycolate oxidase subunit GlcE [Gammaproteobacteria bacterium]|nr:glycolate oxidase subunit GlcE [Gammaproteobacteria bacterium]